MIALATAALAAVWVPTGPVDTVRLETFLAERPGLHLGIGIVPEESSSTSTGTLARLWLEGRITPLVRLPGDPILPLAPATRRDLRPLLALARQWFQRNLGRPPEGFLPGGGAVDPDSLEVLESLGFRWADAQTPRVEALEAFSSSATAPAADPLAAWTATPEQRRVAERLAAASADLERYQNSGTADIEVLDRAAALLRRAESSRFLADPAGTDAELVSLLVSAYELLGQRPPQELVASTAAAKAAGVVAIEAGPGRISFENADPGLPGSTIPCTLERLEVAFDAHAVTFAVTLGSSTWPEGGTADVYVDINRRQGIGTQRLLSPAAGFLRAADAWEFVVSLSSIGASVMRAGGAESVPAYWHAESRRVSAAVPTQRLRGKPGYWGYFVTCACTQKTGSCATQPGRKLWSVLASREEQRQLDDRKRRQPRFSAQRLDAGRAAATVVKP
ncbi:MAG: hypothetical protein HY553_12765 [Elusimicrobia bacterium]|nr:hypothetical protein [Elusimicrobiota bacterium]